MSSQANGREVVPPARTNQRTFLDDVILTFSSPMAWLLVVALIITWAGVAIVLFDLLDYKTLAGNTSHCWLLVIYFNLLIDLFFFLLSDDSTMIIIPSLCDYNVFVMFCCTLWHFPSTHSHPFIHISFTHPYFIQAFFNNHSGIFEANFKSGRALMKVIIFNNVRVSSQRTHTISFIFSTHVNNSCFNTGCV